MEYTQAIELITVTAVIAILAGWLAHAGKQWLHENVRRLLPPRHLRHQATRRRAGSASSS